MRGEYIHMIWQLYFASLSVNISVMENPDSRKFVKLRTGALMPTLGMGTWHHGPKHEIHDALRKVFTNLLILPNVPSTPCSKIGGTYSQLGFIRSAKVSIN